MLYHLAHPSRTCVLLKYAMCIIGLTLITTARTTSTADDDATTSMTQNKTRQQTHKLLPKFSCKKKKDTQQPNEPPKKEGQVEDIMKLAVCNDINNASGLL